MLLSLPSLDPTIPVRIVFDDPNAHHLALAKGMLGAGMLRPRHLRPLALGMTHYGDVKQLIYQAWESELAPLFEFQILELSACLNLPDKQGSDSYVEADEPICSLTLHGSHSPPPIYVGRAANTLEEIAEGLGYTVLKILDDALDFFCLPCTPAGAYQMACMCYWQGEKDEKDALDLYGEEYVAEDTPTREELFLGIPEWAYGWQRRKRLSQRRLAELTQEHRDHPLGQFLHQLVALQRLNETLNDRRTPQHTPHLHRPDRDDFDGEVFEPPAALYWSRGEDETSRIFDDYFHGYMESGGGAPYLRFARFVLHPTEIADALRRIRHTGRMCQALDKALAALRTWENSA